MNVIIAVNTPTRIYGIICSPNNLRHSHLSNALDIAISPTALDMSHNHLSNAQALLHHTTTTV